ncbi:MAG: nickel-dependent lactate racemase [Nitrospinae bacterium]|nr:nickel-dependent lactate racemase [Nitrospinota bacterium]
MGAAAFRYGEETIPIAVPDRAVVIGADLPAGEPALTVDALCAALDAPVAGPPFGGRFAPGDRVTVVIPDQTRPAAVPLYLAPLLDRLEGTKVTVLIANGQHRPLTDAEIARLAGAENVRRVMPVNHDPDGDLSGCGVSLDGAEIRLNRRVVECDRLVVTGACGIHYLAGFGGGRKGIMPGVAARGDILRLHRLSLNPHGPGRHPKIGPALLDGNPMGDLATRVMEALSPAFLLNTILDRAGRPVAVAAGDPAAAFTRAVEEARRRSVAPVDAPFDTLVASCGGAPKDIDFIQAHKGYDNAVRGLREGGRLFLMAACPDGIGASAFLPWLAHGSAQAIDRALRAPGAFAVSGQTAMATREKSARFPTTLLSALDPATVRAMGMTPAPDRASFVAEAEAALATARRPGLFPDAGFVTPFCAGAAA